MTRRNWAVIGILLEILLLIAIISYACFVPGKREEEKDDLSVVVYESGSERWRSFRQGIEQAARDYGAMIHFVELSRLDDTEEEKKIIAREQEQGTDGIIAALTDSGEASDYVAEINEDTPVVLVENVLNSSEKLLTISADQYAMGQALAQMVCRETPEVGITILYTDDRKSAQQKRLEGFQNVCKEENRRTELITVLDMPRIQELRKGKNVLVTFNDSDLEKAAAFLENSNHHVKLYGIGNSEKVVYALEHKVISGIIFQNEFNMGYEAVDTLIQMIRKEKIKTQGEIDFHEANYSNLHDVENERLLYPIIQ